MSSAAAQAYARVANTTSSPRDIEAQALLTAANKLQAVMTNADAQDLVLVLLDLDKAATG